MNITLDMNKGRTRFFSKFKGLIHKLIFVKNIFIQQPSKVTMDLSQWDFFVRRKQNEQIHQIKKGRHS